MGAFGTFHGTLSSNFKNEGKPLMTRDELLELIGKAESEGQTSHNTANSLRNIAANGAPDDETADKYQAWVDALRSGMYPQTDGYLFRPIATADHKVGYCCLGVYCYAVTNTDIGGIARKYMPSDAGVEVPFSDRVAGFFATLNDAYGYTFEQIADVIEALYIAPREQHGEEAQVPA